MGAKHRPLVNIFTACERAAAMLLEAGFELRYRSNRTESRYYGFPGREYLIRVAAHKSKKGPIGMPPIAARITFYDGGCSSPLCMPMSDERLFNMVASAIGIYMIRSMQPPTSRYKGKRGTWEVSAQAAE